MGLSGLRTPKGPEGLGGTTGTHSQEWRVVHVLWWQSEEKVRVVAQERPQILHDRNRVPRRN